MNFISVIIPVYNGGKTLDHCLKSVFKSSYPNFECIVVDDHSTDNTAKIAESFKTKIIRLDRQCGAAYARNRGAELANGDVFLFIDSDVTIYPDSLEKVAKTFELNPEISALLVPMMINPDAQTFYHNTETYSITISIKLLWKMHQLSGLAVARSNEKYSLMLANSMKTAG